MADSKNIAWRVYLLRCSDGSYYCGASNDVARRLKQHNAGKASKYTKSRLPAKLVAKSPPMGRGEALSKEAKVKKLPRQMKVGAVKAGGGV